MGFATKVEAPFPLKRAFYLGVLPGLLLTIAAVVLATAQTVRSATTEILLQLASDKVDGIAKGVAAAAPEVWRKLLGDGPLSSAELAQLARALADEQDESQVSLLKIYGPDRRARFSMEAAEIGNVEDKPALREALERGVSSVSVEADNQGNATYELYIPYRADGGGVATVFELYEPIAGFDALVWKVVRPVLVIPLSLFAVMLASLAWLVARAQTDINRHTSLIVSLRQRLERLVSHRAAVAMRTGEAEHGQAQAIEVTLLYSDVRGFTSFAEQRPPSEVIDFLNRIIGVQVDVITARGGDVDKMIGDAVLARFHGSDGAARAVDAALAMQVAIRSSGLPRGIGVGLFSGPVVAGLIGSGDRLDYTVVGDSVNSAARLCAAAHEGEIIADSKTAAQAPTAAFGPDEPIRVKGRAGALTVRRLMTAAKAVAEAGGSKVESGRS